MTERQLGKLCQRWQRVLGLQDWTVTARFAERKEFKGDCAVGETSIDFNNKIARVIILNDADKKYEYPNGTHPVAMTLIHELVHLHIEPALDMPEKGLARMLLEQGIQALAKGYYNMAEVLAVQARRKK